jgi:hypothetical protein
VSGDHGGAHYVVDLSWMHLPPDHPLRRFLKPYEYRTVDVNHDAAVALSPEGGLVHRTFGLTYGGLTRLLLGGIEGASFTPFPDTASVSAGRRLGERYPYAVDGQALDEVIRTHVADYLSVFHPAGDVASDPGRSGLVAGHVGPGSSRSPGPAGSLRPGC